jgi:hypothetical protein
LSNLHENELERQL